MSDELRKCCGTRKGDSPHSMSCVHVQPRKAKPKAAPVRIEVPPADMTRRCTVCRNLGVRMNGMCGPCLFGEAEYAAP